MRAAGADLPARARAILWGPALVIGAIAAGTSCGISSIAPYNPDGAARPGSGGASSGAGGNAVATGGNPAGTGGAGPAASGGAGDAPGTGGSGGLASGGRAGQVGVASGGAGGQVDAATGGRGGRIGAGSGGSGTGGGGSGAAGGGSSGAGGKGGGAAPVCQSGDQRCSGKDVQNCSAGQWGPINACGTRQICEEAERTAQCRCKSDPICTALVSACASASTIASCAQDTDSCLYQSGSSMCATGTCNTAGGSGSCCACTAGGPACTTAGASQTCALALVCGRTAPTVCTDMNWAQWPMPNGPADVSNGASNPASYTDNGDGTVTDKVTGLMWEKVSSGPHASWSQAVAHCPTLTLGGHNDWRLPSRIELLSLVDYSVLGSATTPMIDTKYFPMTPSEYHWTSTPRPGAASSEAWIVNFYQGGGGYNPVTLTSGYAMCVR